MKIKKLILNGTELCYFYSMLLEILVLFIFFFIKFKKISTIIRTKLLSTVYLVFLKCVSSTPTLFKDTETLFFLFCTQTNLKNMKNAKNNNFLLRFFFLLQQTAYFTFVTRNMPTKEKKRGKKSKRIS